MFTTNDFYNCSEKTYDAEFQHLLRGQEGVMESRPNIKGLSPQQVDAMLKLAKLKPFKDIRSEVQDNPVSAYCGCVSFAILNIHNACIQFMICAVHIMWQDFDTWLETAAPEQNVPTLWAEDKPLSKWQYSL